MNLLAHSIAQCRVDPLVAAHAAQAFEFRRHDGREEVAAVTFDFQVFAAQAGGDELADLIGRGVGHGAILVTQLVAAGQQAQGDACDDDEGGADNAQTDQRRNIADTEEAAPNPSIM